MPMTTVASNASVTATGNYAGGLVGFNIGTISNATSEGPMKGAYDVGGIAGRNDGSVSNVSTSVDVTAVDIAGGLIGYDTGPVTNSTATGTVTATGNTKDPATASTPARARDEWGLGLDAPAGKEQS